MQSRERERERERHQARRRECGERETRSTDQGVAVVGTYARTRDMS